MELKDTVGMMTSSDYKERFRAEYRQTLIRYERLCAMLHKYRQGELEFQPACPIALLEEQCECMLRYLSVLEKRARVEGIELRQPEEKQPVDDDIPGCLVALVPRKSK